MTWHVGDTALHLGERVMVKADRGGGRLSVEDDEGFAYAVDAVDLVPVRQAEHPPCHWCGRDTSQGDYVRVSTERAGIVRCCDVCYERGDEGVDIPLDMSDLNLEGDPNFNGAFRSW